MNVFVFINQKVNMLYYLRANRLILKGALKGLPITAVEIPSLRDLLPEFKTASIFSRVLNEPEG